MKRSGLAVVLIVAGVAMCVAALAWWSSTSKSSRTERGSAAVACALEHDAGTAAFDDCVGDAGDRPVAGTVTLAVVGGLAIVAGGVMVVRARRRRGPLEGDSAVTY